jgi:hypothetical protein
VVWEEEGCKPSSYPIHEATISLQKYRDPYYFYKYSDVMSVVHMMPHLRWKFRPGIKQVTLGYRFVKQSLTLVFI